MTSFPVHLSGITVRNLKNISITFCSGEIILLTGVSGSGKSSLAFDTLYAAGRKRYIATLPTFFSTTQSSLPMPKVQSIQGLSPTIAVKQNYFSHHSHATLGSTTELFSHLALLFTLEGKARDPQTKQVLDIQSKEKILATLQNIPDNTQLTLLAPVLYKDSQGIQNYIKQGYTKIRIHEETRHLYSFLSSGISDEITADLIVDTLIKNTNNSARLKVSLFSALSLGEGCCFALIGDIKKTFSTQIHLTDTNRTYPPLSPEIFSQTSLQGRCSHCQGSGLFITIEDPQLLNEELSIRDNCCALAGNCSTYLYNITYQSLADTLGFDLDSPWKTLPKEIQKTFLWGGKHLVIPVRLFDPITGKRNLSYKLWKGILNEIGDKVRYAAKPSERLPIGTISQTCPLCQGSGIDDYAAAATWEGKTFVEFQQLSLSEWFSFLSSISSSSLSTQEILHGLKQRLSFLIDLGLGYLTPNRALATLSGGEQERTALAKHLGAGLRGITYILDEPSIGLHPKDTDKLIRMIQKLRDQGNTIILVEHDERMISFVDRIIDVGPGAGIFGGEVLFNGKPEDFLKTSNTLTAKYLRNEQIIAIPESRSPSSSWLSLTQATTNNLKNISIRIPLERLTAVTGVSGSGKSSLINDTLVPSVEDFLQGFPSKTLSFKNGKISRLIHITRDLPGRSLRSIPLTFIKAFDEIRELFASQFQSISQGLTKSHFSFNLPQGACMKCRGLGSILLSDSDTPVVCPECQGLRYQTQILEVSYQGKNISDILTMTVYEAEKFFSKIPSLHEKIYALYVLGLDHLPLGRPLSTLSGGEIQRLKLAHELLISSSKQTLYILDEPTTGLHTHDVQTLIQVLLSLTNQGHTVVVIEHNMHIVKVADHVLELGPDGGWKGGYLLASCSPKDLIKLDTPTAKFLSHYVLEEPALPSLVTKDLSLDQPKRILIEDAHHHNLKHLNLTFPNNSLIAVAGASASGKHTLIFDILYASGNIAYAELFPPYIRQELLKETPLPHVGKVSGLSPVIAVKKRGILRQSRHTLASALDISDNLEKLFALLGQPFSPVTGEKLDKETPQVFIEKLLQNYKDLYVTITTPISPEENIDFFLQAKRKEGFLKIFANDQLYDLEDPLPEKLDNPALVIQHIKISKKNKVSLLSALSLALSLSPTPRLYIQKHNHLQLISYSLSWRDSSGKSYPEISRELLSTDHKEGQCQQCCGSGKVLRLSLQRHKDKILHHTPLELFTLLVPEGSTELLLKNLKHHKISPNKPIGTLNDQAFATLCQGTSSYKGLENILMEHITSTLSAPLLKPLLLSEDCPTCEGWGLHAYARHIRIGSISLTDIYKEDATFLKSFLQEIKEDSAKIIIQDLMNRLTFIEKVGLNYISLNQKQDTLSDGERYRLHLAKKISSNLTDIVYLLEDPLSGLHPHDLPYLAALLKELVRNHNTVIATDRDFSLTFYADHSIYLGPKSGPEGGFLCSPELPLPTPIVDSPSKYSSTTLDVDLSIHHMKNLKVSAPLHSVVAIAGVSGSGKTTLLLEGFYQKATSLLSLGTKEFSDIIVIDSHPQSVSQRSDISTYFDIASHLRTFYASLTKAKALGISETMFSTNTKKGQCPDCLGMGFQLIDRAFYALEKRLCPTCAGFRIQPLVQEVLYEGKHFGQLLQTPISEVAIRFSFMKKIQPALYALQQANLDYLPIGKKLSSLSLSEKIALKIAKQLYLPLKKPTLILIDELASSLDLARKYTLPQLFQKLVSIGHSIIYVEHNTEILKHADYLIELGPKAGKQGGKLLFSGTPKNILNSSTSLLKNYLFKS
ncbi:excinuclease ABC subunit UvrA [Chlamydia sp. 17-3921]|uniref:excinuclease ABC subunit UvrA n=1 Tax=Chlamydia sp. 17-3921 TaxID=2675798 RepID=UPI00191A54D9|nr:excinuclease ABC subunit UvrA [Chlamydia sp. 17-3921]